MIYLDSSALLKLVFDEAESAELETWLHSRPDAPLVSSDLARVEVARATRRLRPDALAAADALLEGLDLLALSPATVSDAARVGPNGLRSLDAIHLASAASLGGALEVLVAYDHRLLEGAIALGLPTSAPGAPA